MQNVLFYLKTCKVGKTVFRKTFFGKRALTHVEQEAPPPDPHDHSVMLDERAGSWCEVPKPCEAARWSSGTKEGQSCYLALWEHSSHHSVCVSVCCSGVD